MRWSMYKDKKTRHFIGSASHAGGSSCAGSIRNLTRGREQLRLGSRWWSTNNNCFPWWTGKKERSNSIQVDGATDNQNVPLSPRGGVNNPIACEPPIRWTWNEKWRQLRTFYDSKSLQAYPNWNVHLTRLKRVSLITLGLIINSWNLPLLTCAASDLRIHWPATGDLSEQSNGTKLRTTQKRIWGLTFVSFIKSAVEREFKVVSIIKSTLERELTVVSFIKSTLGRILLQRANFFDDRYGYTSTSSFSASASLILPHL